LKLILLEPKFQFSGGASTFAFPGSVLGTVGAGALGGVIHGAIDKVC
jgi:hypothetical protein